MLPSILELKTEEKYTFLVRRYLEIMSWLRSDGRNGSGFNQIIQDMAALQQIWPSLSLWLNLCKCEKWTAQRALMIIKWNAHELCTPGVRSLPKPPFHLALTKVCVLPPTSRWTLPGTELVSLSRLPFTFLWRALLQLHPSPLLSWSCSSMDWVL